MIARWERYWFANGGRHSLAIVRIGIALAVWMSLTQIARTWPLSTTGEGGPSSYYAFGLLQLLGRSRPSPGFIEVLWIVARVSTIAMGVGLGGRIPAVISFVAASSLAALSYSGSPSWSHEYNVVFCAQLAICFAPTTDAVSLDAVIRRVRHQSVPERGPAYQWAVRLAQLTVALMFASAAFHKLTSGGGLSLDWALSDNLRNQLIVHFDSKGLPRTAAASWLVDDVWRYRGAALLNLVSQLAPLGACFSMRRPLLRAAFGACFLAETLGLGFVMDLWDWQWLPLVVVFVDWDALLRRPEVATTPPRSRGPVLAWVTAFIVLATVVALRPSMDRRYHLYPFTSFPMFSSIRARAPYGSHAPYTFEGGHIEVISTEPVPAERAAMIDRWYAKLMRVRSRDELVAALPGIFQTAQAIQPGTTALRVYYVIFEVTPYPSPAAFVSHPLALLATVDGTGVHSLLGSARRAGGNVTLTPGEPTEAPTAIDAYVDQRLEPQTSPGGSWQVRDAGRNAVYTARIGDQRWVIAR